MVDPIADPSDVRIEINTGLDDSDINSILERVARDNDRVNGADGMDGSLRRDLEAAMAALVIAEQRDRSVSQQSLGSGSKSYEASTVDSLKRRVRQLDPSNGGVIEHRNQWTVTRGDVTDD